MNPHWATLANKLLQKPSLPGMLAFWLMFSGGVRPSARSSAASSPVALIDVSQHGVSAFQPGVSFTATGPAIEALMRAYPSGTLYFPKAKYLLAGAASSGNDGLVIGPEFRGELRFADEASFVCDARAKSEAACVHFLHANHVSVTNLRIGYLNEGVLPGMRNQAAGYALLVDDSHSITLTATSIENSPGACFWASNDTDLTVHGIHVSRCTADGVHFENDKNVDLEDMWSSHTLDDGLAFTSIERQDPACGAYARDIHIEDSAARGISVPGGCDIVVSNFSVDRTGVSGVLVDTDGAFHMRRPSHISFRDGSIARAGMLASSSGGGNKFGIEVSAADYVSFDRVQVTSSASRGFDVSHGATHVSLVDSSLKDSGGDAINLIGASDISLVRDQVHNAYGYGAYLRDVANFSAKLLTLTNVSSSKSSNNLHRAFWVDNPAGTTRVESLNIVNSQPEAGGYIVGCSGLDGHAFVIAGLRSSIRAGALKIECTGNITQSDF